MSVLTGFKPVSAKLVKHLKDGGVSLIISTKKSIERVNLKGVGVIEPKNSSGVSSNGVNRPGEAKTSPSV
jgi:hypothetical protein